MMRWHCCVVCIAFCAPNFLCDPSNTSLKVTNLLESSSSSADTVIKSIVSGDMAFNSKERLGEKNGVSSLLVVGGVIGSFTSVSGVETSFDDSFVAVFVFASSFAASLASNENLIDLLWTEGSFPCDGKVSFSERISCNILRCDVLELS